MIFLYFFAIFIALFILYGVSRHDFVLLRQSISLRTVFDNAFISLLAFLIFSRIAFIFYTFSYDLFSPLKFLYLTRNWGIMPYAGILLSIAFIAFLFRKKKNKLRILDIYLISYTPIIILDVILKSNSLKSLAIKLVSLVVLFIFYGWFIKIHNKFTTKDGFIGTMTIITYTLVTLAFTLVESGVFSPKALVYDALLVLILIFSLVFLTLIQKDKFNKQ